jgi:aminodeoxychorismate synthase component I
MNRSPHRSDSWRKMTPWEIAQHLAHVPNLVFFDSSGNTLNQSGPAISIVAADPEYLIQGQLHLADDQQRLREIWQSHQKESVDCGYPLGGLCGFIDYDGSFCFGHYPHMLIYQHEQQQWREIGHLSSMLREHTSSEPCQIGDFRAVMSREEFIAAVERIREWIAAGDIYQVNLTQQFTSVCDDHGSLAGLYSLLRNRSPAPMAAWLKMAGREILSSSPETFLRMSGRQVETRPIKGTRPRFVHADDDRRSAYELQTSPKEISELVMITDLLRNDLGQVCDFGSVYVDEMLKLETFEQVFHLVSTVRGEIRRELDAIDVLAACFPGGSITGAPKKRAREIISELEPVPRGLYCGTIGYLGYNGESQFNIAIRTLVRENGKLHYHVGAGIVADSQPAMEHEETLHKARGIQLALADWRKFVQKELNKPSLPLESRHGYETTS